MSKLDIKLVEKMYADYGQELTPDRIEYIKSEFSNNNDFSNSFLRKYDPEKSASEIKVEKKNPDTTGTSSVAQSDSQELPKKKRSLLVGGEPVQAGASGSSVGKNKGERSSEQLLSELGFKNKEEQKKAGAVASKVKVGGATPVGVKSTPKKEEVFKTEKQKAVEKEGSLITDKYKREEEEKFVENFRGATALPEGYEDQVKEDINSELQGTGFWNTISQGASEAWNKVLPYIPGAPSSESELKQLESEVTFLPKAKEEYRAILIKQGVNKDEITDEVLTKGAIDLEVKKRVEDKKLSLANDYLDNLPNDIKSRMESKALNEVQINNPEVTKGFNLLKTLDADIKKDNDELVKLEELSKKNNGLSPEDADRYGSLTASLKSKIESRNKQYNSYKEKVSKLTTAEQEYDLFKRTYGFEDKAGKILNSVYDFGLGSLQFINMLTPGANQDNIALELAGIKSKKDKLVAEKFQKQVDDSKNINDILDYGSDVLISQSANIALGYLTGGTGMMVGMGTSAAGNRYSGLIKSNLEGETDYSKLQMYLSSGIYGASEMIESNTMKMIGGAKNVIGKAIKNEPSRKIFAEGLATKTYKTGKEFIKNYKGELGQELTTFTSQKISDIVVLDIDSKDVFKNAKEEIKSLVKDTGAMVVGLNLFPATFAKVINTFSPKDYTYNLDKNNKMIDDLSKILNNKDASDVVKAEAKSKIDQIVKSNEEGLIKVVKNTSKLDDKLVDKVVEIEIKNSELRNKANQINEDKTISKDQKKILLSGLKDEFTKNELLREDIVGGRKSSFDILPEDQSTKFKEEAANVLKKEELDKGVEENKINISAEDINNKAKELYNQKINKENEKSTRETDTEEKPTGANTEQTISAVQQKDGNAELQKEVDKLREEEIKELTENVENPESFITDGKVDAKKVSESDNAKAKEIYAKYDKLIKPLLNNIKTQEDAVQKQSTNEGLLQPEQSEMGLQKMEQGDAKQEVVAEQSKEKVNNYVSKLEETKASDPDTYWSVSPVTVKDASKSAIIDTKDGAAMVKPDGDIVGVFKKPESKAKGVAQDLLNKAVEAGGIKLDNYDGYLTKQYEKAGFRIVSRTPFNEEFKPPGWNKEKHGTPDVVAMVYDPKGELDIQEKTFTDKDTGYDDMLAYRDKVISDQMPGINKPKDEAISKFKEDVNKALDRLSKAYDAYKNVNVIFDPEGQWKKDKELVSSLVDYAVSNIKLGAYNASNLLKDLKAKGFEITKEAAEFIFQKASGPSPKESTANTKAEVTELKGQMQDLFSSAKEALKMEKDKAKVINKLKGDVNNFVKVSIQDLKAGDIGKRAITSIASKVQQITDQNFEEKLGEINDILSNLYTNRDVNKAKSDKKKALKNVMSGKVGKLDKRGDRDKVMSSKIVNFALLNPETLKKVLDDATFGLYTDYINRLGERKDALSDTDLKSYEKLYDEITIPYKKYTDKVNEIQGKIDTNQDLSDSEQKFVEENKSDFYEKEDVAGDEEADAEKKAKKEAEILKKKEEIKSFIPLMKDVFQQSNAEKGSFEWKILSTLVNLDASDVDSMPDNMLTNATNALRSMVENDVIPTYAEDLYRYTIKNKAKNLLAETVSKAGKGGLYKTKAGRAALKVREILGNPLTTFRGLKKGFSSKEEGDLTSELLEKRIKMFRLSAIDAALNIYGETPLFDGIMSVLGKGMSNLASTEARAEEALLNAKKLIDRKSKNPQESYMKITYYLIDAMAKNNQGTKSDVEAIEYFNETVKNPESKIRENGRALKIVKDFIDKVNSNNGIVNLTPDEATAANAIRIVLEENQIDAYEALVFQLANSGPMINEYFPVSNSLKSQAETDLSNMQNRFGLNGAVSTKSGNLEDKSGKAHPIDMNPFTAAFSSIKNTAVQFNLRSEYLGISAGLKEANKEAVANEDKDSELFLNGIRKALESEFDLIINGASFGSSNLMDDVFNAVDRTFYQVMLGSVISRSVDFTGNLIQLAALNPKLLVSGSKILKDLRGIKEVGESEVDLLRGFYKNAEASDINKMISAKSATTERTEFLNKGVSKSVLSKGLPTLNIFSKSKAKVIDPIDEKLTGINEGLLSMSDVKPYGIAWNSIFRDVFLKETGKDVDVAKIARGDKEYLKANKDSIRKASNQANRESADLFGSTNPFERQVGIMEVAAGKKNSRNPLSALANRAKYFLGGFTIGANTSMTTSINTFIETKDPREARKALGGAIRMGMYRTSVAAISGLLWSLFKGDDEDEDKLVESFDRLSDDDKFIKKMNNLFLDFPIQKDRDGNQVKLSIEDFKKYNKLRDELLSNEDFKNAYDIYYKYINRNLFDNAVRLRANELNSTKKKLFKEDIIVFFDDIKNGFPKTDQEIINALAIMHSDEGAKLFTSEEVDGYILDIENHMAKIGFLDKRALRSADSQIDRMIINETATLLSEHRNSSVSDIVVEEGAQILMGLMFPRSNNLIKGSYNYLTEGANKMMIQSRRGDRGYDLYKDMIFQPVVKYGLLDKSDNIDIIGDSFGILNPALKDLAKRDNKDAATVSLLRYIKTIGTIGLNDFNKINSKMKNDNIYQKTNGRFKENIINDIAKDKVDIIRGVTDKEGLEKDLKDKEAYKSRVLPGLESTEVKSKLPSYMDKKDLKINGRSVE
jgi:hypothetical protein